VPLRGLCLGGGGARPPPPVHEERGTV